MDEMPANFEMMESIEPMVLKGKPRTSTNHDFIRFGILLVDMLKIRFTFCCCKYQLNSSLGEIGLFIFFRSSLGHLFLFVLWL